MDRLDTGASAARPHPWSLSSSSSSHAVTPKKRASLALKGHSSAGTILLDHDDGAAIVDKKPRLEPDAGVLVDRANVAHPAGSGSGRDVKPVVANDEIGETMAKLDKYMQMRVLLRKTPPDEYEPDHWETLDKLNAKIGRLSTQLSDLRNAAASSTSGSGGKGGGGGGGGGIAGGTGWHLDEAARQRLELERQEQGGGAVAMRPRGGDDAVADIMNTFSGFNPSSEGNDGEDPYDAMARIGNAARVRGVARTQEFDEFVKKALEGESFEGNANGAVSFFFFGPPSFVLALVETESDSLDHVESLSRCCRRKTRSQVAARMRWKDDDP